MICCLPFLRRKIYVCKSSKLRETLKEMVHEYAVDKPRFEAEADEDGRK